MACGFGLQGPKQDEAREWKTSNVERSPFRGVPRDKEQECDCNFGQTVGGTRHGCTPQPKSSSETHLKVEGIFAFCQFVEMPRKKQQNWKDIQCSFRCSL